MPRLILPKDRLNDIIRHRPTIEITRVTDGRQWLI
jgi:hypothetical protein